MVYTLMLVMMTLTVTLKSFKGLFLFLLYCVFGSYMLKCGYGCGCCVCVDQMWVFVGGQVYLCAWVGWHSDMFSISMFGSDVGATFVHFLHCFLSFCFSSTPCSLPFRPRHCPEHGQRSTLKINIHHHHHN